MLIGVAAEIRVAGLLWRYRQRRKIKREQYSLMSRRSYRDRRREPADVGVSCNVVNGHAARLCQQCLPLCVGDTVRLDHLRRQQMDRRAGREAESLNVSDRRDEGGRLLVGGDV